MHTYLPIISSAGCFYSQNKYYDPVRYPESSITNWRTVIDYEIELFSQDGGICHLNNMSYPIKKGNLLITQPGDKRRSTLHFTTLYLHFNTNDPAIKNLIHSICGYHTNTSYEELEPTFSNICDTVLDFEPDSSINAAAKLISFLYMLKKEVLIYSMIGANSSSRSIISEAIDYMKTAYMDPLTVSSIAKHCNVSTSYLHKLFTEIAHTTPNNYLLNIRLSVAKSLLTTTTMPISEIASNSGFNSQCYFSDCFKRQLGITPKEFRKSISQNFLC